MSETQLAKTRKQAGKKAAKSITHAQRVANAKKAWETIRANQAKAKKGQSKPKPVPKNPAVAAA
jgi:hypothetical protein